MLCYRPSSTQDPEERLEDAALWKAMHDHYGAGIHLLAPDAPVPEGAIFFGRAKGMEQDVGTGQPLQMPYWEDPGFLGSIQRDFKVTDLEGAEAMVADLHAAGKDAFLKGTRHKQMTQRVPVGTSLSKALGDMIWSFIDRTDCLMVQEAIDMSFERRFVVIDREIVTDSAVAWHLTPLSRADFQDDFGAKPEWCSFEAPSHREPVIDPWIVKDQRAHVEAMLDDLATPHAIVDVCLRDDGTVETVEFNTCHPGMFGLYACSPAAIARASGAILEPGLLAEAMRRKREDDPWPAPEASADIPRNDRHAQLMSILSDEAPAASNEDPSWDDSWVGP